MKPKHVTQPQRKHLEAAPYSVAWWGGKVHARPFDGFNSATHDRLVARGWIKRVSGERGVSNYEITLAGRHALEEARATGDA